jgi:hypothetical protein
MLDWLVKNIGTDGRIILEGYRSFNDCFMREIIILGACLQVFSFPVIGPLDKSVCTNYLVLVKNVNCPSIWVLFLFQLFSSYICWIFTDLQCSCFAQITMPYSALKTEVAFCRVYCLTFACQCSIRSVKK